MRDCFPALTPGCVRISAEPEADDKPERAAVVDHLDKGWVESFGSESFEDALLELSLKANGHIDIASCDNGSLVQFSITDDGPGIPAEYHERVFRMFQTLRPRDEVEGNGVGLAVVRRVVESQGGTITVESGDGRRTCFRFT